MFLCEDTAKAVAIGRLDQGEASKNINESGAFDQPTPVTEQIGQNVAAFLVDEMKAGRIPPKFLPLQSGVGNIANAVLAALGNDKRVPSFEMYTEVLQDSASIIVRTPITGNSSMITCD